jgi:hypothetical protein
MSRISTLFTLLAIAGPVAISAQAPKRVATSAQINASASYAPLRRQEMSVENTSMMAAKPMVEHRQVLAPNGKVAAVAPIPLGTASNGFTSIRTHQNQVVNCDSLGIVGFIHRQDINIWGGGTTENGRFRYDLSIDGGMTFTNDIGPVQTTYTNYGRYPQFTGFNPGTTNNPFDSKFVWIGPTNRFPTPGWLDQANGLAEVGLGAINSTDNYDFDSRKTLLPGGLTEGLPGEFWTVSFQDDGTNAGIITDSLFVMKGTYNTTSMDVDWTMAHVLVPGYDMTGDGDRNAVGPNIAFSPDGMHGWIAMVSNIGTDPKNTTLFPVFFHSTDGGATWGAPTEVDMDQFPWVADSLQSLWTDSLNNPASSGLSTTAFDFDITVDNNGDVHMAVVVGTTAATAFSISSGLAMFMSDVHSTGGGTGWDMTYISPVLTFRGEFGTGAQTYTQDNFPQIARNNSGGIIFYSWVDSDTATATGNMTGVGFQNSDNVAPNLRIAMRRVFDGSMAYPKMVSDLDLTWDGKMLAPTMAPVVHKTGNKYELPIVAMELVTNDISASCAYHYFGHDAYFDLDVDQWCDAFQHGRWVGSVGDMSVLPQLAQLHVTRTWSTGSF